MGRSGENGGRRTGAKRPAFDRRLVVFLATHLATGVIAALVSVAGLVGFNVGGLRDLAMGSDIGWVAILVLTFGFIITFGSAAMGLAVMTELHRDRHG